MRYVHDNKQLAEEAAGTVYGSKKLMDNDIFW